MAWSGEALAAEEQDRHTPFASRCTKDVVEEQFAYDSALLKMGLALGSTGGLT
jgi:hypothetical protein